MDITIILATFNRAELLSRTLESFANLNIESIEWEVVVVDNADDSVTETLVRKWSETLPLHYSVETKNGKSNALNSALPKINGDLVVLTDDDIIADKNWLQSIRQGVSRWPEHLVFGGQILPAWPLGFDLPNMDNPFLPMAYAIADWSRVDCLISADKIFGPNMVVRREIFDQGWRFNENIGPSAKKTYRMGSETEFLMRLDEAGYQFVYLPETLVYHQIRPEQMSLEWLKNRAHRAGLSTFCSDEKREALPKVFGVPRYLLRMAVETWCKLIIFKIISSKKLVENEMRFKHLLGQISMHRGYP